MNACRRDRRGAMGPVLMGVVGMFIVLGFGSIAHMRYTSHTLNMATRDAGGAVAEELACSAIEEALAIFQKKITDPADPLFMTMRNEIVWGRVGELDLSKELHPKALLADLESPDLTGLIRGATMESFRALAHIPALGSTIEQFIDFECSFQVRPGDHDIVRRVVMRRRYGMMLASPFKPFDQLTLAILTHEGLIEIRNTTERIRRWSLEATHSRDVLLELLSTASSGATTGTSGTPPSVQVVPGPDGLPEAQFPPPFIQLGRPPTMPSEMMAAVNAEFARRRREQGTPDPRNGMEANDRGWLEWATAPNPTVRARFPMVGSTTIEPFDTSALVEAVPAADSIVFATEPTVKLDEFDYDTRLDDEVKPLVKDLERTAATHNAWFPRFMGATVRPAESSDVQQWAADLKQSIEELDRIAKAFQKIALHVAEHTRVGFVSDSLPGYLGRQSRRVMNLGYHIDSTEDLARTLAAYPTFNGHLSFCGPGHLDVRAERFGGKAIISAEFGGGRTITLQDLKRKDQSRDLILVMGEDVTVAASRIEAGLFVDRDFTAKASTQITGNLILGRLEAGEDRKRLRPLRGTVTYDPNLYSGALWERKDDEEPPPWTRPVPGVKPPKGGFPKDQGTLGLSAEHHVLTLFPRDLHRAVYRSRTGNAPEGP